MFESYTVHQMSNAMLMSNYWKFKKKIINFIRLLESSFSVKILEYILLTFEVISIIFLCLYINNNKYYVE